jgi:hypothetical protein
MKKIVASVGLVALGASGIQTTSAQVLGTPDATKPWSLGVTLRGFYDNNTATVPDNTVLPPGEKKQSWGYEVSPQAALIWSVEQTTVNLGFLYSLKYYENRPPGSTGSHADQAFTFTAGVDHTFSERLKARVNDSFVIGQEPDLLRAGNTFSTFQRVSGDNIRNYGSIGADAQITPKIGVGAGYDNSYYDYKDTATGSYAGKGIEFDPNPASIPGTVLPTTAGLLNRIENRFHLEGLYQILPETKALVGYQFTDVDYYGGEWISGNVLLPGLFPLVASDSRNSREHTGYLGLIHNFSPQLSGSIRAGASYTEYYNDSNADNQTTPYVNANLRYTYAPESYVEGGFSYDRNPTDVVGVQTLNGTSFTLDAESAVVYGTVHHRITSQIYGSVIGQYQSSKYNGGAADGKTDNFFLVGLELEYRINPFLSAHAGYDFDRLDSDLQFRSFSRNRVYFGVTASY